MTKLTSLGEFGLIEQIKSAFSSIDPHGCEGIGDDCAVIPCRAEESFVVTTDLLIEEVHFLRRSISPQTLGEKALSVNLSDIAAMGATPWGSFLSLALPVDLSVEWIEDFLAGYHACSTRYNTPLLGGDTTRSSDKITISVTAIGLISNRNIKRRSDAVSGDRLFVTGALGDSAQGLSDLLSGATEGSFIEVHLRPTPCVREGEWLGKQAAVHAMMDLSDGLSSDLPHILRASHLSAEVLLEKIPTNTNLINAITGGEDYQLLLSIAADQATALCCAYEAHFNTPLYEIGSLNSGKPEIHWLDQGQRVHPNWQEFTHF